MVNRQTIVFRTALDTMFFSGTHHLLSPFTAGSGVVFTLHHVRPAPQEEFSPNRILEITPEFLEQSVLRIREAGYDIVTLDEAWRRLKTGNNRPFAALTFDDGYRDVRDFALPILRKHNAPCTLFITASFADGTGDLWWLTLEEVIRRSRRLEVEFASGDRETHECETLEEKTETWDRLYWRLRAMDEHAMRRVIAALASAADIDPVAITRSLCMDWHELRAVAQDPLVTIGAHSVNHYMLAKWPKEIMRDELAQSRARIESELGILPKHFAYPVGDATSAKPREFAMARELGFETAWTTRPGHLYPEHKDHPTALPRVSLNGDYQQRRYVDLFLSGAPFAVWNGFRRVNVG